MYGDAGGGSLRGRVRQVKGDCLSCPRRGVGGDPELLRGLTALAMQGISSDVQTTQRAPGPYGMSSADRASCCTPFSLQWQHTHLEACDSLSSPAPLSLSAPSSALSSSVELGNSAGALSDAKTPGIPSGSRPMSSAAIVSPGSHIGSLHCSGSLAVARVVGSSSKRLEAIVEQRTGGVGRQAACQAGRPPEVVLGRSLSAGRRPRRHSVQRR